MVGLCCTPLSALIVLQIAHLLGSVVDALGSAEESAYGSEQLIWDCFALAGLAAGDAVLRFTARHQLINASRHMERRLKSDLALHLGTLPIAWFDRARTGDILSRLTQDVELVRFVTGPALLYGSTSLVLVPGGVYMMFAFSPLVAAAAITAFALMLVGIAWILPRLHRHSKAVQETIGEISQHAAESFGGIRVLSVFGRTRAQTERMRELSDAYVGHNVDLARLRAGFNVLVHSCRELVVLAVVVLGAVEVARGTLTIGQLLTFLSLLGAMIWPLLAIGFVIASWHRALAAADRIEEVFEAEPEPISGASPELRGEIEVAGLTFSYPGQSEPALRDVSLRIAPGQRIGLVGPVGSGKSTLLAILLRFYDPPRGTVRIDGHDILDLHPAAVRRLFALAPQDPFLFSDTLAGNIGFGHPLHGPSDDADADRDPAPRTAPGFEAEVDAAAATASLDADRGAFPEGWDTIVGERGVTLSGGQKQRVSLARALAAQRGTLLLDDTLSAVDLATERRILDRLREARGDRALVVAAHRLSIVKEFDAIHVFDRGQVVASGDHAALTATPGYYADTWRRQSEESWLQRGATGADEDAEADR